MNFFIRYEPIPRNETDDHRCETDTYRYENGAKQTLLTAPSVKRRNPWATSKVAVRHLKNLVLLHII
jgi:hypothetical protein